MLCEWPGDRPSDSVKREAFISTSGRNAGYKSLDQDIGVRVPGGQPIFSDKRTHLAAIAQALARWICSSWPAAAPRVK